jgi:hypothetical protein
MAIANAITTLQGGHAITAVQADVRGAIENNPDYKKDLNKFIDGK